MTFIDVHCHVERCKDKTENVIKRMKKANVIAIGNSVNPSANRKIIEIAEKYPQVKVALGCYPIEASEMNDKDFNNEIDFIRKNKSKLIAIGEIGLDFKESNKLEIQTKRLQKFIDLSFELDVPMIIHSRKAELECIELLEKNNVKKVIMHCFSGNFNLIKRIISNGWYISIPTNVTFSEHFQKIIEICPIEQLFCETDSPFLHPIKGQYDNEPCNVVESYKKIAEIKKISLKGVEKSIEENYKGLFGY